MAKKTDLNEKSHKLPIDVPLWKTTAREKLDELIECIKDNAPSSFIKELRKLRGETK